ncbi:DUF4169 family protein [Phenylobacterium sp. LH3H17]|uniref:DUF4169 family protein n=1 Tax=Phenylobacterium sp. LH3H17 TaxID=2903901 RepID=UPI0020C96E2B|nr:DUF4169 family protein [Phenylobacterium sp. LH3H17]UTP38379.1 DUF4169 family protein [Phenylobacterium sp. LH3H17]
MTKVVSLNKARKAKVRDQDRVQAARNRAAFGRPKAEKALAKAQGEKADRALDGAKRED